jgi:hypothetical protein
MRQVLLMFVKLADKLYSSLETFSHKGEREFPFYLQVDHSPPLMGGDKGRVSICVME